MIKHVLILGGGSAGFLAAGTLKARHSNLKVTIVHSTELGIIGVGEGTIPIIQKHLHGTMNIDPAEFFRDVRPTWKLGIRYEWGPREYFNYTFEPQLDLKYSRVPKPNGFYTWDNFENHTVQSACMAMGRVFPKQENGAPYICEGTAYHLENEPFVRYLTKYAERIGVEIIDNKVVDVAQDEHGIKSITLESQQILEADLFVDCSGFASILMEKALEQPYTSFKDRLLCDRAVVGGWMRKQDEPILPYTTSETMDCGWCWRIDHAEKVTRGYVYSSDFISDEAAEAEFRRKNPRIDSTRVIRFKSGRHAKSWVKNVVAIGNANGFVEPLEATSIGAICFASQSLAESLAETNFSPTQSIVSNYNDYIDRSWNGIVDFLTVHYKFNTRLDNEFWRACRNIDIGRAERYHQYYVDNGPSNLWKKCLIDPVDQFGLDAYLAMFIGLQVPHNNTYQPGENEWAEWRQIQAAVQRQAAAAYTQEDALKIICSPKWNWSKDFYKQMAVGF
ncbi:MAG: tryptophan halogenase [Pirellulaceae bacterium]|jgi:tryptophan halogenase